MNILLRPTRPEDLDFVQAAESHEDNRNFIRQWTRDEHQDVIESADKAHLVIQNIKDNKAVGYVILEDLKDNEQGVQLRRIVITEKGRGFGKAALQLIKKLVFSELGARRLWLDVFEGNARARKLYNSEGFSEERRIQGCAKTGDGSETMVVMGIEADTS
ncbi:MAG: GNAT family N-acetyltransferase [Gammaproteobacteria bacterium]|nr:GNAT family N-acetyltransferase [Gammaproteobacteria bacterium]